MSQIDDSEVEFNLAVLDYAETALEAEGICICELPGPDNLLWGLFLHDAWKLNSNPKIVRRLKEWEDIREEIGIASVPDQAKFWRIRQDLKDDDLRGKLRAAAKRAVYNAYFLGDPIPESVKQEYGFRNHSEIDPSLIPYDRQRKAMRNWMEYFLDYLLEPITFGRDKSTEYEIEHFIAAIAQAGLISKLESAERIASWHYDSDDIPSSKHTLRLLNDLKRQEILDMFEAVDKRFMELAGENGFFDRSYSYAVDTTTVSWDTDVGSKMGGLHVVDEGEKGDADKTAKFVMVSAINKECRFAFGIDLTPDGREVPGYGRNLLRFIEKNAGVKRVVMDREFWDRDAVRTCREVVDNRWLIRAKRGQIDEMDELFDETPVGESDFKSEIPIADVTPKPYGAVHPVPEHLREEDGPDHYGFITDMDPEQNGITGMYLTYVKRWSIEVYIKQLKHHFGARTESPSDLVRLFLLNIAKIFHNIHAVINRAPSPQLSIPLEVTYYEVLQAFVDEVYTRNQ